MRVALLALLVSSASAGAPVTVRCGALFDPVAGKLRPRVVIAIDGERVTDLRDDGGGAATIDLSQLTCLPGLIDAHTHVIIDGALDEAAYQDQLLRRSVPYRAIVGTRNARRALEYGFTTLRDVGVETAAGYPDVDVKRAIEDGVVPGPRMRVATRAIGVAGAYPMRRFAPEIVAPQNIQLVNGPVEARAAVRDQLAAGADWIKVYADKGTHQTGEIIDDIPTLTPEELHAITDEAHRQGHRVAAHAGGLQGVHNAVEAGVDSIEHGLYIADEDLRAMKARGIVYVPTLYIEDLVFKQRGGSWLGMSAIHARTVHRARELGVSIGFGTDAGGFDWTQNPAQEFVSLVQAGLTPAEALRAATTVNARLLALQDDLGAVARGKLADLVAVPGNPLEDVRVLQQVKFVMRAGRVYRQER